MKKFYLLVSLIALLIMDQNVQAATLNGKVKLFESELKHEFAEFEDTVKKVQVNWFWLSNFNDVRVVITDASGVTVHDGVTTRIIT